VGKFVNIGGQLVPLDQARQILHAQGLDGLLAQYTAEPAGEAYDEGTTTGDGGTGDHITPAQAFQAADPNGNGTTWAPEPTNSTTPTDSGDASTPSAPPTNTFIASSNTLIDEEEEPWSNADLENDGRWSNLDRPGTGMGESAGKGTGGGYENPYPGYRYAEGNNALDLIAGSMGGHLAAPPSLSATPSASASATASSLAGGVEGMEWSGKPNKGWQRPGPGYIRPPQASSAMPTGASATPTPSATDGRVNAPVASATPVPSSGGGFWDGQDGADDQLEDETWGDWVSAQAEPSAR
jgi:hypothetical protein